MKSTTTPDTPQPTARPFPATLEHLDRDGLLRDCDEAIESAVQAVITTGGDATLTLKIKVKRRGQNQVTIEGQISKTLPRAKPLPITLFATPNGLLHITNPDQQEFAEVVKITDKEVKKVS